MKRPAYQLLADELREEILEGRHRPGDRLPGEAELSATRGVSRSTVREAMRLLEAQQFVVTTRGTTGGSFVVHPRPGRIENELGTSLDLLVAHSSLTVDQILEARELLEVPAAGLAARRRSESDLGELGACIEEGREGAERFHLVLLRASGNPLVEVMTRPLFAVQRNRMVRDRAPAAFWEIVEADHRRILDLVRAGDAEGVQEAMRAHLRNLAAGQRRSEPHQSTG
jgi:DNA-binding FadR family transcriptional regulator